MLVAMSCCGASWSPCQHFTATFHSLLHLEKHPTLLNFHPFISPGITPAFFHSY